MGKGIAVISKEYPQVFLRLLARHEFTRVDYQPSISSYRTTTEFGVIILVTPSQNIDGLSENISSLRLEKAFRGRILVASFFSQDWIYKQEDGELLKLRGCTHLQLPFLVDDFDRSVTLNLRLTDEELSGICGILRARRVDKIASLLSHEHKNKFALVLTHLREIEKLSYYKPAQPERVFGTIEALNTHLTREKVQSLRNDCLHLTNMAKTVLDDVELFGLVNSEDDWKSFDLWFSSSEKGYHNPISGIDDMFLLSNNIQSFIKKVLAGISNIRDDARQVISNAQ